MNCKTVRLPAEWEAQQAVMIAWPHALTDWNYMLSQVVECYCEMARAIARFTPLVIVTPEPDEVRRLLADVPPERITFL